jgi:uncharacterized protein (DUF1501 family)
VTLTRRQFVKGSLAAGVSLSFFSSRLGASTLSQAAGADKTLVVVQLIGGNDTLNTFIPYTDSRYRSARPTLAIPDAQILQVDPQLGFHPAMAGLRDLYLESKFAFITNVGFSSLDRSHFRCQDVWHTANENPGSEPRGWLGRWADLYAPSDFSPVAEAGIAVSTPRGIAASRVLPTCLVDVETFDIVGDPGDPDEASLFSQALRGNYSHQRDDKTVEIVRETGKLGFEAIDILHQLPPPSVTTLYGSTPLGRALRLAAQMIAANRGTTAIWVTIDGFDTHRGQVNPSSGGGSTAGLHASLLADLSSSLTSFQRDIEGRGLANRVMVLGWSEFGRRVEENASYGTDHGKAGSAFLLGKPIRGGRWYGDNYDLTRLDEGDLIPRLDFRTIYATIIRDFLGGDPELVLGRSYENLGFIEQTSRRRAVAH